MAWPIVTAAGGAISRAVGFSGAAIASAKGIFGLLAAVAAVRALLAVVVGALSFAFLPAIMEGLPDIFIPSDLQSRIGPTFLFIMDLFALDICLQIMFSALTARFVLRRFA